MKVTFLGTGTSQGIPVIACECEVCRSEDPYDKRLRTSAMIEVDGKTLVIDTGPDFRQQMLREKVKNLDAVLFTHQHKDHTGGMDDIRAFNFFQKKDMDIYANDLTMETLKKDYDYVFHEDKYPGVPSVNAHLIDEKPFHIGGLKIIPLPVLHYKLPVLGFRIGNFAYITDANYLSPETFEKIKGVKVLVLNALRKTDHISHFTLNQAIEVSQKAHAHRTYLTHLSHLMGKHQDIEKELPKGVHLAHDGLKITV